MYIALWVIQGLLALAFMLLGGMKAFLPLPTVEKVAPSVKDQPAPFVRFIGGAEILGAIGILLPAILNIQSWLTVAAAGGLCVVVVSAAIFHSRRQEWSSLFPPVVLLVLAVFVLVGRLALAPL